MPVKIYNSEAIHLASAIKFKDIELRFKFCLLGLSPNKYGSPNELL